MDRISTLPSNKIAKELQGYKRYSKKTQKEIKDKLGNVDSLRDELRRLEIKKSKKSPIKQILVNDVLKEILLRADVDTIKNYCLTNNEANKLCHSQSFWNEKLKLENLPVILFDKEIGNEFEFEDFYELTGTQNKWMILYILMKQANVNAKKMILVNKIEKERAFRPTKGTIGIHDIDFHTIKSLYTLPSIKNHDKYRVYELKIIYDGDYKLIIYMVYDGDEKELIEDISYQQAINIITLFLYEKFTFNQVTFFDSAHTEFYYNKDGKNIRGDIDSALKYMIYETLEKI